MVRILRPISLSVLLLFSLWSRAQTTVPSDTGKASTSAEHQTDTSASPAEDLGEQRMWIEPSPNSRGTRAVIEVTYPEEYRAEGPLSFECDVSGSDRLNDCVLRLQVCDATGAPIHQGAVPLDVKKGPNPCRFTWTPSDLRPGVYTAHFELIHRPEGSLAERVLVLRKLAAKQLERMLDEAAERIGALREHLGKLSEEGRRPPYAALQVTVAEDFIPIAREALSAGDWRRADSIAQYALKTSDTVRTALTFGGFAPALFDSAPSPDLAHVEIHDGEFLAGDRPVFLLGVARADENAMPMLRRYGLNLATMPIAPRDTLTDETAEADLRSRFDRLFESARRNNVSLMCDLDLGNMPEWALAKCPDMREEDFAPGGIGFAHPAARKLIERHIRTAMPFLATQPMLNSVCLISNPRFHFGGDAVRAGFVARARAEFPELYSLNRTWRGRLLSFDEIQLIWDIEPKTAVPSPDYMSHPPYTHDWLTYHQGIATEFIRWMSTVARESAGSVSLQVAGDDSVLDAGESTSGVDREALARLLDINGCTTSRHSAGDVFAINYPHPEACYTLLRSMAPDKPLFDSRFHVDLDPTPYAGNRFNMMYAMLWEAAMNGADAVALDLGNARSLFDPTASPLAYPECVEAVGTACLDLNRLRVVLTAFQHAPTDVAIVWNTASKIFEKGDVYLSSLLHAYEGASFFGLNVRFVTERQVREGALDGIPILVLPNMPSADDETFNAVESFIQKGGFAIRRGRPFLYNERGISREGVLSYTNQTFLLRGEDSASHYLHALDAAYTAGRFERRPRIINEHGYPCDGVISRTVPIKGQPYLYVLNLRKEPVQVHLEGAVQSGRDLIHERSVFFPMKLESLDPMLIRMEPVPQTEEANPPPPPKAEGEVPTAEVGPVPAPPEPPPRPFKVPDRREGMNPKYPPAKRPTNWRLYQ